jgi:polysaccharide chain length determinant protein (PEP-CTERM system associated)
MAPACGVALATAFVVTLLPNRYTSQATLVVTQPMVSARYVEPGTTTPVSDAVNAMTREVLSRTRLLGITDEVGLYEKERERLAPEVLVERMLEDIKIVPLDAGSNGNFTAFQISFVGDDPLIAQRVTSRLTSFFIEENLKRQGSQAESTANFLNEELDDARKKLEEREARLQSFKVDNLGELPEQQQVNMASLMDARSQLQSTLRELGRAERERTSLDAQLRGILARLQSERLDMLSRFTARHPEILKKDDQIAKAQAWLGRLLSGARMEDSESGVAPDDPAFAQLERELQSNAEEIVALSEDEKRLRAEAAQFQRRLNLVPVRDQELAEIQRDYELFKKNYDELLAKQLESQLTINLEERQQGRQFRVVDPPTLPVMPSSPERLKLSFNGVAAGLLLGLALAFYRNSSDSSFYSEKDLSDSFSAPLVLSVPLLLTPAEERTRRWGTKLEWLASGVLMLSVCAAELYIFLLQS